MFVLILVCLFTYLPVCVVYILCCICFPMLIHLKRETNKFILVKQHVCKCYDVQVCTRSTYTPSLTLNTDANPFSFQYFYNTPRQILLI